MRNGFLKNLNDSANIGKTAFQGSGKNGVGRFSDFVLLQILFERKLLFSLKFSEFFQILRHKGLKEPTG
jgi:hypothetical protein